MITLLVFDTIKAPFDGSGLADQDAERVYTSTLFRQIRPSITSMKKIFSPVLRGLFEKARGEVGALSYDNYESLHEHQLPPEASKLVTTLRTRNLLTPNDKKENNSSSSTSGTKEE